MFLCVFEIFHKFLHCKISKVDVQLKRCVCDVGWNLGVATKDGSYVTASYFTFEIL